MERSQWTRAAESVGVRFTKRPQQRTSLEVLQRLLDYRGKDNESLVVMDISAEHRRPRRLQMNRHMLLNECSTDVRASSAHHQHVPYRKASLSRSNSAENLTSPIAVMVQLNDREGDKAAASHTQDRTQSPARSQFSRRSSLSAYSAATTQRATEYGVPLQLRDLRVLLSLSEPTLLVRRGVFVLCFGHIRALVTARRALFILSDNDPAPVNDLRTKMAEEPEDKVVTLPFELLVLEAVFQLSLQASGASVHDCLQESESLLSELRKDITPDLLNRTYMLKGQVSRALQEVKAAQREMERIQRDDATMALMNLSDLYYDTDTMDKLIEEGRAPTDHIQVLLDTYSYQLSALANRLEIVAKQIEATEDHLNLRLESIQKNTFVANALFHMILTFLGLPTLITGMWGMNLWSGHMYSLDGPFAKGPEFKPPDFPVDEYNNDPALGVSWIFLWNSVGIAVVTVAALSCAVAYVRRMGLGRVPV